MRRLSNVAAVLCAVAVVACTDMGGDPVSPPHAASRIVGGAPAGAAFSSVGALLIDWWEPIGVLDGRDQWCTGTLIAPTVFLTAAHCVLGSETPPGTQFYVSFAPDLMAGDAVFIAASGYQWAPLLPPGLFADLAVVFLDSRDTEGITPAQLPRLRELDALAAAGGLTKQLFVNVGYGVGANRTGPPGFSWDGKRRVSRSRFLALQPTQLGLLMSSKATGEGGDCYGDSGGPKFLDGDDSRIYATVVTGDALCRATSWDARLDTPGARAFLGNYVSLP